LFGGPRWPHSQGMDNGSFPTVRRRSFNACSLLALGVALAISSAASVARAQSTADAGAPSHEKRAQVAYALQDWPTAIREFEAAFQDEQKPDFLWGIAQAQRQSGDCKAAITTYKSYRRSEISADQSAAADSRIQHCEEELQQKAAQAATKPEPQLAHPALPPPSAGAPATSSAQAPAPAPPEPARPFYADAFGDVLVLTGVAAAGAGTYFLLAGNSAMRAAQSASYSGYDSDTHHASREQLIGATTLAGGGLFIACGVVRFLTLGSSSSGPGTALTVSPLGFDLRGRF
jgi:hypothetical protein